MEVSAGATLIRHKKMGDRVVLLHLTLGEAGNPRLSPEEYAKQKRQEAEAAAKVIGAEVLFGPYQDGHIPDNDEARSYVADVIRDVRPATIMTHWRNSIHRDHVVAYRIVSDAILLAALANADTAKPAFRGVRSVYYPENWEDNEDFHPYFYVNVASEMDQWKECVTKYEFVRGGISPFPYLDYYTALARVRGADAGRPAAEAFEVNPMARKRVVEALP